jgi:twin arginine-targeting protein translocase, TatA/E family
MSAFILAGVIGPWQVVLIVAVALLLFGGKKIPELMGGLGKGMKEFKKAMKEEEPTEKPEEKKNEPLKQ